ncbi:hypothetical protein [Haloplanus natans]|uniref:hypothetical protein n=1 Tax=Haloplanus natans TaxID=376171 RepID=UPI0012F9A9F8|nr:hypothetical protein [Haloplanus natans]
MSTEEQSNDLPSLDKIKGHLRYDLKAIDTVSEQHAEHIVEDLENLIEKKIEEADSSDA